MFRYSLTIATIAAGVSAQLDLGAIVGSLSKSGSLGGIGQLLGGLGGGQAGIIGDFAQLLSAGDVQYGPQPTGCSDYEILFARGTGEPGPMGAIVGDGILARVQQLLPGARGYSVHYPASLDVAVSPNIGADDVINRLNQQSKACPNQTFALVGYSQGASVMHLALSNPTNPYKNVTRRPVLDKAANDKVKTVVLFGDPGIKSDLGNDFVPTPPFSKENLAKVRENCRKGDPVCDPTGAGFENHVLYTLEEYQVNSTNFIVAGFRNEPLPAAPKTVDDLGLRPANGKGTSVYQGIIGPVLGNLFGSKPAAPKPAAPAAPAPAAMATPAAMAAPVVARAFVA